MYEKMKKNDSKQNHEQKMGCNKKFVSIFRYFHRN